MSKNLKEFQRWFSKDGSFIPSPGDAGYEGFIERRKAWQAALEWALQIKIASDSCIYLGMLRDKIRKELEE